MVGSVAGGQPAQQDSPSRAPNPPATHSASPSGLTTVWHRNHTPSPEKALVCVHIPTGIQAGFGSAYIYIYMSFVKACPKTNVWGALKDWIIVPWSLNNESQMNEGNVLSGL